jgi:hypothetical protein
MSRSGGGGTKRVGKGRLRAFDLRREQRFFTHVLVEKQTGVRQHVGNAVEAPKRAVCPVP